MADRNYIEHSTREVGPLLLADATMGGRRVVWVGTRGGMDGAWMTHAEFRQLVSSVDEFAQALPPSGGGAE